MVVSDMHMIYHMVEPSKRKYKRPFI